MREERWEEKCKMWRVAAEKKETLIRGFYDRYSSISLSTDPTPGLPNQFKLQATSQDSYIEADNIGIKELHLCVCVCVCN
jgi:hypothetical protein